MPNISDLQNNLNNCKKIIIEFKDNINDMIIKLNNIVQNIDDYFNVYANIINSFVIRDKNYIILQNINYLKTFNDNFIYYINQININKDYKFKINHIIQIPELIDFNIFDKEEVNNVDLNQGKNDYNSKGFNDLKTIKTLKFNYDIGNIIVLNDGRLLITQDNLEKTKLSIYNIKEDNNCDIEYEFEYKIWPIIAMNDRNIIVGIKGGFELFKINEKSIEKIKKFKKNYNQFDWLYKLSENEILIINNGNKTVKHYLCEDDELKYNGILKLDYLNLLNLCLVKQKEIVIYFTKFLPNQNHKTLKRAYISFYDTSEMEEIETLVLGKVADFGKHMLLMDDNNLIVNFNENISIIDINTRKNIYEFRLNLGRIYSMINFDKNHFIIGLPYVINLYNFDISTTNNIIRFEDNKAIKCENGCYDIIKYQENKIIIKEDRKTFVIYGK